MNHALTHLHAAKVVETSFYVDDVLTGADSLEKAIELQRELHDLFSQSGFLLRNWNSSDGEVLQHIPSELQDTMSTVAITDPEMYTKAFGIEWSTSADCFRLSTSDLSPIDAITKRSLVSDIAKTFDVLGWFAPTIIKAKMLFQKLWKLKVDWDEKGSSPVLESWRDKLHLLSQVRIPCYYFNKECHIKSIQWHGFSDASKHVYSGVVFIRGVDTQGNIHVALVTSKTKVAPIRQLTISRLELCGAQLLAQLLGHVREVFQISLKDTFGWTDSTIVLNWLKGSPRRF